MVYTVALFGEAEKGDFCTAHFCNSLDHLAEELGNPPSNTQGLFYATQLLMFRYNLIFFRVKEEGFSLQDYFQGFRFLENRQLVSDLLAICLPGVGNSEVIEAGCEICHLHKGLLLTSEPDFYDYVTG